MQTYKIKEQDMENDEWVLRNIHREWYYVRVQITGKDLPDLNTWKLLVLRCLQQKQGVFGESIEFDILSNECVTGNETILRVHFQDRVVFLESLSVCVFDEESPDGGQTLRVVCQSASLDGVVVPRTGWTI